ncbi:protein of unknown function [uncultured Sphingopyxis sp.]|uniref:Uncharacterized protein n=1 Tax=uncultured Sphingopyxis sp. TaxID=310581 RepID=A0A1Y5PN61_9SPHN|nr:protein of unknown function [uncultured Sphingopyxis sp.]
MLVSRSGVGNRNVAAHPRPLPQAGGEKNIRNRSTTALQRASHHRQKENRRGSLRAGFPRVICEA